MDSLLAELPSGAPALVASCVEAKTRRGPPPAIAPDPPSTESLRSDSLRTPPLAIDVQITKFTPMSACASICGGQQGVGWQLPGRSRIIAAAT